MVSIEEHESIDYSCPNDWERCDGSHIRLDQAMFLLALLADHMDGFHSDCKCRENLDKFLYDGSEDNSGIQVEVVEGQT